MLIAVVYADPAEAGNNHRIRPYEKNPYYWQYQEKPVLLLGGSWQDNLFNFPVGLSEHLDLLVSVGGNYVRNTMSHRKGGNSFAFVRDEEGRFDLNRFNQEYWDRFEKFLKLTHERNIIVQIEIWDPHDYYRPREKQGGWVHHPFNPLNNVNYTPEESGLPTEITYGVTPSPSEHAFFRSVPSLDDNEVVLAYQNVFVDKLLDHSLKYPHVLYCIDNEIGELTDWSDYWASYIQRRAGKDGATAFTADMRRDHNIRARDHHHLYDHPDLYTFLDISQVTGSRGQSHYDEIYYVRNYISGAPRPINNVKNYGAAKHSEKESVTRFIRMIFAGGASSRFHRPFPLENPADHEGATKWGLGLSPRAQAVIRAMREFDGAFDIFRSEPSNDLLSERDDDEAYLLAVRDEQYALYFPSGGSVKLDLSAASGDRAIRRLDIDAVEWREERTVAGGSVITVSAPGEDITGESAQRENLIINGGFETPEAPPAPGYTGGIHGWTVDDAPGCLVNSASGPFYTPGLGPIPEGLQVFGMQGTGALSQVVHRLQHGQPFAFSFRANCREGNDGMDLTVKLGSQILWSGAVTTKGGGFHSLAFEGVYDSDWGDTLRFEFSNPQGDATVLVDNVELWTIPSFGEHCIVVISPD